MTFSRERLRNLLWQHGKLKLYVYHAGFLNRWRNISGDLNCSYLEVSSYKRLGLRDFTTSCFVKTAPNICLNDLLAKMYAYDEEHGLEIRKVKYGWFNWRTAKP